MTLNSAAAVIIIRTQQPEPRRWLLKATASQAGEKIGVARQKIEQSLIEGKKALADAEQTLRKKSKECAEIADDYVRENPWSAVGIAAAVGLAFGLLIRGK